MRLIVKNPSDLDPSQLREMVSEVNSQDRSLENLDYYENDDDFFNTYFSNNVIEAVRAVSFGDYNYSDDYVRFDAYENLESASEYEYYSELENYADEIAERYLELVERVDIDDVAEVIDEEDLDIEDDEQFLQRRIFPIHKR